MSKWISFAWTTPALRAGVKTVTRRQWNPDYARRFKAGDEVIAYDRQPRNGGKPVARLRLTHDATYEPDAAAPDSDYVAEGFEWFWLHECERSFEANGDAPAPGFSEIADRCGWDGFDAWRQRGGSSWVVRFELVELVSSSK